MLLLAIDTPAEGAVSDAGFVWLDVHDDRLPEVIRAEVVHGGFDGFVRNPALKEWLAEPDTVVCEKYVVFGPGDSTPRLAEGVVRYLRPDVVLQPSTGYKSIVTDTFLKKHGYWTSGKEAGHHAELRSAVRHGLHYLAKQSHRPLLDTILA